MLPICGVLSLVPPRILETYPDFAEDKDIVDIILPKLRTEHGCDKNFSTENFRESDFSVQGKTFHKPLSFYFGFWRVPLEKFFSHLFMDRSILNKSIDDFWQEIDKYVEFVFVEYWRYVQNVVMVETEKAKTKYDLWKFRTKITRDYYKFKFSVIKSVTLMKFAFKKDIFTLNPNMNNVVSLEKDYLDKVKNDIDEKVKIFHNAVAELQKQPLDDLGITTPAIFTTSSQAIETTTVKVELGNLTTVQAGFENF